jgi:predicted TPR repeat methyltransferase
MSHFVETILEEPRTTFKDVRAHFSKIAPKYKEGSAKVEWCGPEKVLDALATRIEALVREGKPLRVLDLGAGTGQFGLILKERFGKAAAELHVTGIDFSPEMLAIAREDGGVDHAIIGSVTELGVLGNQRFDIIVCCGVSDFLTPEAARQLSRQIPARLAPNGVSGITFEPVGTTNPGHKTLQHDLESLRAAFLSAGATILSEERIPDIYKNSFRRVDDEPQPVENIVLTSLAPNR